jgi:hypothetical protein
MNIFKRLSMKGEIDIGKNGKNLDSAMRAFAKDLFKNEFPKASCICIGVKLHNVEGNRHQKCVYARSGDDGRRDLVSSVPGMNTPAEVGAAMGPMSSNLVSYRSATVGTSIIRKEPWTTHNCAESNLAFYVLKNGGQLGDYTIASFHMVGGTLDYFALCKNCAQWCQNSFRLSRGYKAHCK